MKETKIFLLDLNPSSEVGCTLGEILESFPNSGVKLKHESLKESNSTLSDGELCSVISHSNSDLIFLVLSQRQLELGRAFFQSKSKERLELPIIVVPDACKPDDMFSLLKLGAADFITPPLKALDILPRLWRLLDHKREQSTLTHRLKEKLGLKQLIGKSLPFLDEIKKIPTVAKCDANVLISGETGTGKDMCARAIHYLSPRASKPFIPFNCGAIPTELMENELFGHVQGAFTGASTAQSGLISVADSGSLFLDDIDCLPPISQAKLLRFLQEKEYRQLGSAKIFHADVRVLAATNTDLESAVNEGKLRRDLYYRLNVIPITLPALRDRQADIPLLALHFLNKYANNFKKQITGFASGAMMMLIHYEWPGNVRELEHVVERAALFCEHRLIQETDICLPKKKARTSKLSFKEAKADMVNKFERSYIERLLISCNGNITKAAQAAQKNRRAFWQLIRKHQIDAQAFKPG
ncbi:MAG: sigma-54 dependent transcriptional regulator [Deltaproteobacteria bacterium]|nr:sigma-54 dependent transcriptional regulator [Deltaproteobacteria bacterium]